MSKTSRCIFRLARCRRCRYGPELIGLGICLHCDVVPGKQISESSDIAPSDPRAALRHQPKCPRERVSCTCGFDDAQAKDLAAARADVERLRAAINYVATECEAGRYATVTAVACTLREITWIYQN